MGSTALGVPADRLIVLRRQRERAVRAVKRVDSKNPTPRELRQAFREEWDADLLARGVEPAEEVARRLADALDQAADQAESR